MTHKDKYNPLIITFSVWSKMGKALFAIERHEENIAKRYFMLLLEGKKVMRRLP